MDTKLISQTRPGNHLSEIEKTALDKSFIWKIMIE